jgi:hypothetical protein
MPLDGALRPVINETTNKITNATNRIFAILGSLAYRSWPTP